MTRPDPGTADPGSAPVHYLSTLDFGPDFLDFVRSRSPRLVVEQYPAAEPEDVPVQVWQRADVLHTSTVFPPADAAPRLGWVQLDTSGADHVAEHPVWHSPAVITTLGGVSPVPLAEYVLMGVLGHAHRMPALLAARARRAWPGTVERWQHFGPRPVAGATLGVVGYGRIGREIGRQAAAHGMRVLGVSRTGRHPDQQARAARYGMSAEPGEVVLAPVDDLHRVLAGCDYVAVVLPLTPATRGLIGAEAIAAMKPGAVLVNVARGGIVDEAALLAGLRTGRLGGAVLDVFEEEPLPPDSPWWTEPNVLITPHVSGLAPDYDRHLRALVAQNLDRFLAGEPLLNQVDRVAGY